MMWMLVDKEPIPAPDLETWAADRADFENTQRVGLTFLPDRSEVSTVFLGIDHSFGLGGPPILFETMIFGGPLDGEQERYCTFDEAETGHREWTARAYSATRPPPVGRQ